MRSVLGTYLTLLFELPSASVQTDLFNIFSTGSMVVSLALWLRYLPCEWEDMSSISSETWTYLFMFSCLVIFIRKQLPKGSLCLFNAPWWMNICIPSQLLREWALMSSHVIRRRSKLVTINFYSKRSLQSNKNQTETNNEEWKLYSALVTTEITMS